MDSFELDFREEMKMSHSERMPQVLVPLDVAAMSEEVLRIAGGCEAIHGAREMPGEWPFAA